MSRIIIQDQAVDSVSWGRLRLAIGCSRCSATLNFEIGVYGRATNVALAARAEELGWQLGPLAPLVPRREVADLCPKHCTPETFPQVLDYAQERREHPVPTLADSIAKIAEAAEKASDAMRELRDAIYEAIE